MNEIFWDYVKDNLTANEYENLAEHISCASKRLGWLKSGSTDFHLDAIHKLAKLLKVNPNDLIMDYGLGYKNITLDEMDSLLAMEGEKLGRIAHVA